MPTLAPASAGASLMPSPTIATILPLFLNSSTALCLSCGSTCARTRGDACLTGNQIGSACVVAGDHHRFNAHLVELGNRFLRVRSDGVRKGNHPPDIVRLPPDRWQYSRRAQWC